MIFPKIRSKIHYQKHISWTLEYNIPKWICWLHPLCDRNYNFIFCVQQWPIVREHWEHGFIVNNVFCKEWCTKEYGIKMCFKEWCIKKYGIRSHDAITYYWWKVRIHKELISNNWRVLPQIKTKLCHCCCGKYGEHKWASSYNVLRSFAFTLSSAPMHIIEDSIFIGWLEPTNEWIVVVKQWSYAW